MSSTVRVLVVVLVLGAVFSGGYLLGHERDGGQAHGSTATTVAADLVLKLDGLPFTFEYPASFAPVASNQLPQGYWAIVGISPESFVDVRLTADSELSDADLAKRVDEAIAPAKVSATSTLEAGKLKVPAFTVVDTSSGAPVTSRLQFLRFGGKTWEIGCQFDTDGTGIIPTACDHVLETLKVTGKS